MSELIKEKMKRTYKQNLELSPREMLIRMVIVLLKTEVFEQMPLRVHNWLFIICVPGMDAFAGHALPAHVA